MVFQTNRKLLLLGIIFIALCGNLFSQSGSASEPAVKPIIYTIFFNIIQEPTDIPLIGFINLGIGNHARPQVGMVNYNSGDFSGFFQGGFINTIGGNLSGMQLGFINSTLASVNGPQIGFINTAGGNLSGMQLGFINSTVGFVLGPQIGFINTTLDTINGAQIGFINTVGGNLSGMQLGFINATPGSVDGSQVGVINTSGKALKGFQFGLINYVDSIESGVPIGLISIIRKGGYYALEYSFTEFHHFNVGFKVGLKQFYTTIFVSYNSATESNLKHLATGAGFGSLIPITERLFFNPELQSTITQGKYTHQLISAVPYFGINLTKRLSITAAPSVTLLIPDGRELKDEALPRPLFGSSTAFNSEKLHVIAAARVALRVQL